MDNDSKGFGDGLGYVISAKRIAEEVCNNLEVFRARRIMFLLYRRCIENNRIGGGLGEEEEQGFTWFWVDRLKEGCIIKVVFYEMVLGMEEEFSFYRFEMERSEARDDNVVKFVDVFWSKCAHWYMMT